MAENISLQRSNCYNFGLTDTMALLAIEARLFQIKGVLPSMFRPKRGRMTPHFFTFLT